MHMPIQILSGTISRLMSQFTRPINCNVPDADETDFSKMELFVELKFAESSDPFCDPKDL
jgi:hypothetical protein